MDERQVKFKIFQKGDWVMMYNSRLGPHPGKLKLRYFGPYQIVEGRLTKCGSKTEYSVSVSQHASTSSRASCDHGWNMKAELFSMAGLLSYLDLAGKHPLA